MSVRDEESKTARQIARSRQKRAGDRSADVANALMKLPVPAMKKLEVDDDLREMIDRARAVNTHIARRRAERALAGELRRFAELSDIEAALAKVADSNNSDMRHFHLAEEWRAKLIEQGSKAIPDFPGASDDELPRLIDAAQRERDTGKPPGAARKLFRLVVELLKTAEAEAAAANEDEEEDEDDNDEEADDDDDEDEK